MSYNLQKPYSEEEYADFIVLHNHNNRRKIEETETALYALEPWEILQGDEVVDNTKEYEAQKAQENKNQKIEELKSKLEELDKQRIRALCEPSNRTENQTWLEYYNEQIINIRKELQDL